MPGVCNRTDDRADWRNEPTGAGPLFIIFFFFFVFFPVFFFRSRKVNVRRRSTRFDTVTRFPTEGFWIKRAMNKRNADASILEHKKRGEGGDFFSGIKADEISVVFVNYRPLAPRSAATFKRIMQK